MFKFSCERLEDIIVEAMPLIFRHYREVGTGKPLDPDIEKYIDVEKSGGLVVFTVREEASDRLVGYAFFWKCQSLHYQTEIEVLQELLYIDPNSRGFGRNFVHYCDEQLRAMGVTIIRRSVTTKFDFGHMLESMGYSLSEKIFERYL